MAKTTIKLPIAKPAAVPKFKHREYATLADPAHKSDMSSLIGEHACTKAFSFSKNNEAAGIARDTSSGKAVAGTAGHETVRRALSVEKLRDQILSGAPLTLTEEGIMKVLYEEWNKEESNYKGGVAWYRVADPVAEKRKLLEHITEMLSGLFAGLHKHVAAVELVEAGFIAPVGELWTEGHIDLVYRPVENPAALAITDWKTGATKPHQITLDHGFESGFYSNALANGLFVPTTAVEAWQRFARDERPELVPLEPFEIPALAYATSSRAAMHLCLRSLARKRVRGEAMPDEVRVFGEFPEVIRLTHLADYELYKKRGKKKVERPEELRHWGLTEPGDIAYEQGQRKGPAWYHVKRSADDVARLEKRLKTVVSWVRFGLFVDAVGEKCTRCSFRGPCLTSGFEKRGDAAKELVDDLGDVVFTGLPEND